MTIKKSIILLIMGTICFGLTACTGKQDDKSLDKVAEIGEQDTSIISDVADKAVSTDTNDTYDTSDTDSSLVSEISNRGTPENSDDIGTDVSSENGVVPETSNEKTEDRGVKPEVSLSEEEINATLKANQFTNKIREADTFSIQVTSSDRKEPYMIVQDGADKFYYGNVEYTMFGGEVVDISEYIRLDDKSYIVKPLTKSYFETSTVYDKWDIDLLKIPFLSSNLIDSGNDYETYTDSNAEVKITFINDNSVKVEKAFVDGSQATYEYIMTDVDKSYFDLSGYEQITN